MMIKHQKVTLPNQQPKKKVRKEIMNEIADAMQAHFEQAWEDGVELGKETWQNDDEPRVRVKWYLDVFVPNLRKGKIL